MTSWEELVWSKCLCFYFVAVFKNRAAVAGANIYFIYIISVIVSLLASEVMDSKSKELLYWPV